MTAIRANPSIIATQHPIVPATKTYTVAAFKTVVADWATLQNRPTPTLRLAPGQSIRIYTGVNVIAGRSYDFAKLNKASPFTVTRGVGSLTITAKPTARDGKADLIRFRETSSAVSQGISDTPLRLEVFVPRTMGPRG